MTDVARRAGVSQSTVSYVLSGSRPISEEVRARVEAAVRELRYAPRAAAQALRGGATNTIVLSMPDRDGSRDGWLGLYLLQLTLAARSRGYDLLVSAENAKAADALERIARGRRADGAILMSIAAKDPRIPRSVELGFPTVALGEPLDAAIPFVDYDFRRAAEVAIGHLAGRGHRSVAYCGPRQSERASGFLYVDRVIEGFRSAAARVGVRLVEHYPLDDPDSDRREFRASVTSTGATALVVTSSFTTAERIHSEFLRTARPADPALDVVAFGTSGLPGDEVRTAAVVNPIDTLATASVDALVDLIAGRGSVSRLVSPQLVLP